MNSARARRHSSVSADKPSPPAPLSLLAIARFPIRDARGRGIFVVAGIVLFCIFFFFRLIDSVILIPVQNMGISVMQG